MGAQATMTNLTAELETDAKRFLTSVNVNACESFDYLKNSFEFSFLLDKSQLQILLKFLKTDRVFISIYFYQSRVFFLFLSVRCSG